MHPRYSRALPLAYVTLRILTLLNRLSGVTIAVLLAVTLFAETWTMKALGTGNAPAIRAMLPGLQVIAALGVVAVGLNEVVLRRLTAIVATVGRGDPFTAVNAERLQAIGWTLLGLQLISLVVGGIGKAIETAANPLNLDAGFSPAGWLGVLLTFVLASIFAEGAAMRDELNGTV